MVPVSFGNAICTKTGLLCAQSTVQDQQTAKAMGNEPKL